MKYFLVRAKLKNGGEHVFLADDIRFHLVRVGLRLVSKAEKYKRQWKQIETEQYSEFTIVFDYNVETEADYEAHIQLNDLCYSSHLEQRRAAAKQKGLFWKEE